MQERTRGMVLRSLRYNDDSIIVNIYTESHGVMAFLVKTSRSRKGGVKSMLLRPLSVLEILYDYRPHQTLQRIRELRQVVAYNSLPYDPMKETQALFLAEFLYYALKHEPENPELFLFLTNSMLWLDEAQDSFANFHMVFLIRLTSYLGIWPDMSSAGRLFDLREGVFSDTAPLHGHYLAAEEAETLPMLLRVGFRSMRLLRMNRVQRARVLDVLTLYYRLHVPEFPELKSLDVLRDVLS